MNIQRQPELLGCIAGAFAPSVQRQAHPVRLRDFLNDYAGIRGYQEFRGDLVLMYFPTVDPSTGKLQRLVMTPLKMQRFRLKHASRQDAEWLRDTLTREGRQTATEVMLTSASHLVLQWS